MAQYENYKLTYSLGFEKIPEEWNLKKVKYLFNIGRGRVISQEELMDNGLYPVFSSQTQNNGCLGYINTFDFDCEQLTWTTDGANAGTVFIRSGKHNCTNVCGTLQPIKNQAHLKFSHYALQYATQFHKRPDTNGAKIMNNEMAEISFALPSQQEQFKIVEYLNYETAQIDSLIAKQEKLIELLKEKRQAVISHAVTKGLNPDVTMKDSGVEWLGQVPEHWAVAKLAYRYEVLLGKMLDESKITGNYLGKYLRNTDVQWGRVNSENLPEMDFRPHEIERYSVQQGDLLVCEGGEIGRCAIWESEDTCFYQKALHRLRAYSSQDSHKFMFYVLFDSVHRERFISGAGKATIAHLPAETFKQYRFAFPPKNEQVQIVEYLDTMSKAFDEIETKALAQIKLLQERRTALISSAVTGKINVSNWQHPNEAKTELSP